MKIICAIQARMGSTRLPGKVLKEINGLPILAHIWRRLLACKEVDEVVVAWGGELDPLFPVTTRYGMRAVAWKEDDNLLSRIASAGHFAHADAVLRVRADCLFLDHLLMDKLVAEYRLAYPRYRAISNWPRRAYSEGMDAEVWSMELLAELNRNPECPREDFGTWAIERGLCGQLFSCSPLVEFPHLSIDTREDFERAERMLKILGNDEWRYAETLKAWEATK